MGNECVTVRGEPTLVIESGDARKTLSVHRNRDRIRSAWEGAHA